MAKPGKEESEPYGDGHAAEKIVGILDRLMEGIAWMVKYGKIIFITGGAGFIATNLIKRLITTKEN